MRASRPEGGWVLVIVLIALALVAWLARDALVRLVPAAASVSGTKAPRRRSARRGRDHRDACTGHAPAKARAIEATVQQGAGRLERDIDVQAR